MRQCTCDDADFYGSWQPIPDQNQAPDNAQLSERTSNFGYSTNLPMRWSSLKAHFCH